MATFDAHKNLAASLVATAPSPATSGTSLVVSAGTGALFPAVPFNCTVCPVGVMPTTTNAEIIRVTNISTDTFTITRAQEGTVARNIVAGDFIANSITVKSLTDIETAVNDSVVGPASATDNAIVLFNGTTGKLVKNSTLIYSGTTLTVPDAFSLTSAGSIALAAGGSNKDITLTPSGTGAVTVPSGSLRVGTDTTATWHLNVFADGLTGLPPWQRNISTRLVGTLTADDANSYRTIDGFLSVASGGFNLTGSLRGANFAVNTTGSTTGTYTLMRGVETSVSLTSASALNATTLEGMSNTLSLATAGVATTGYNYRAITARSTGSVTTYYAYSADAPATSIGTTLGVAYAADWTAATGRYGAYFPGTVQHLFGGAVTLGISGTSAASLAFLNATSGSITLAPPAGALGTVTLTLPAVTGTLLGTGTTVTVAQGGSGIATTTAYSPIFSGTTATGAWKADTGPGTSGQVLTSTGAASYPTWQAVSVTETVISPTQLAADTDDWNPTNLATATVIRVDTDASLRYLSSITAPASVKRLRLENISANTLILKDDSAALGTAANRMILGGQDLPLFPADTIDLIYDTTSSRWRAVNPMSKVMPPRRFGWYGVRPSFPSASADTGVFNASSTVSGTAAANTITAADSANVTNYILQTTGTDTTGRSHFGNVSFSLLLGNNWYWRFASRINIVALSDGTETFTYWAGLIDASIGNPTDGVFLRYTHSVNSGNFELVLRSNGSETPVNCSAGPAANTWCDIAITVTPTRVEAYKDGVLIGSTTTMTNLPSGSGRQTGIGSLIIKSAGTTARTALLQSFELVGYKGVP
jgi:hypothetical protein